MSGEHTPTPWRDAYEADYHEAVEKVRGLLPPHSTGALTPGEVVRAIERLGWRPPSVIARFEAAHRTAEAARAEGAAAEREACAQVVEGNLGRRWIVAETIPDLAAAIRACSGDGDPLATHDAEVAARALESIANNDGMGAAYLSAAQALRLRQIAAEFRAGERST